MNQEFSTAKEANPKGVGKEKRISYDYKSKEQKLLASFLTSPKDRFYDGKNLMAYKQRVARQNRRNLKSYDSRMQEVTSPSNQIVSMASRVECTSFQEQLSSYIGTVDHTMNVAALQSQININRN